MVTKMKNGKTLGIMLAIANAVLAIVSVVLYIGTDQIGRAHV